MRSLNPYVVSWGNIIDYVAPADFHAIAKSISGEDTVHYVHSCNWITRVYGADIFDINPELRGYIYEKGFEYYGKTQRVLGFSKVPISHFRNICQPKLIRKFIKSYMNYFFENEQVVIGTHGGGCPVSALINPFLRSNMIAHFMFSYNCNMNFGADKCTFFAGRR